MASPGSGLSRKKLVITLSGLHGTGKSTLAKRLAEVLGLRYISAGKMFREIAEVRDLKLEQMSKLAEKDNEFDRLVDKRTKDEALKGGVVIDAALSGWMVEEANIKIFLIAPFEVRKKRIAARESLTLEEAGDLTRAREKSESERFRRIYGVDPSDMSIYDVVLNTELFDADGTARILKKIVEEYCGG